MSNPIPQSQPPQAAVDQIIGLYNQGRLQEMIQKAEEIALHSAPNIMLFNLIAAANAGLKNLDLAIENFQKVLEINPQDATAYYNIGNIYREKEEYDAEIESYKKALSIKPDHAQSYNNMGSALKAKGDITAAINSFKQALNIKRDFAEAHYNLGVTLHELGEFNTSIKNYKRACEIKPDYIKAYLNMGRALKDAGDLDAAMDSYKKALKISPNHAYAYFNMGTVLQDKGELDAAIESYTQAVQINPEYAQAYYNMGVAQQDKGELNAAMESYKLVTQIKPKHAEAYNNLGLLLHNKGELNAAMDTYKLAQKINPEYAGLYNNMGLLMYNRGEFESSISSYKQALKIKPNYAEVWNNIVFPLQATNRRRPLLQDWLPSLPDQANFSYTQIANSILKHRLNLGNVSTSSSLSEALVLLANADNIIIKNPFPRDDERLEKPIDAKKIVGLVHFGRSGTGLLHSLIDGHPEVSTLPSIYFSEFFDHTTWEKITMGGWSEMVDRFITTYEVLFDAVSPNPVATVGKKQINNLGCKEGMTSLGKKGDEVLCVDKKFFHKELNQLINSYDQLDASSFFKLVHSAYNKALNDRNKKTLVFYHIHNPDWYAKLNFLRSEPNTNWLMMVREPVQSCESWVQTSFVENDYEGVVNKIFQMLFEVDYTIFQNGNSVGVRLEDLKMHPEQTIPALCDWLGIKEEKNLYEMTAQGKKWWGDPNSPDYEKDGMNPFGKTSINRKLGLVFSKNDQFILRTLFYPFSVRFGYEEENTKQFKIDLQAIRPMLDQMFDFEKKIVTETKADTEQFVKSGSYLYLRSGMIQRWNTLNEFHTYLNMLKPLKIN